jgi:hypothetical protein
MARAVMDLIADDHRGLPRKRMEWIGDLNLASQTSGIMASRRTTAAIIGP